MSDWAIGGEDYDVIVAGAGPAGSGAAIRLALGGARVLLVEREHFPRHKLCGEFISPECLAHFARLGVEAEVRGGGGKWIAETIFYAPSGRAVRVPSAWLGGERAPLALGLSRAEMDLQLLRRARAVGVDVREGAATTGLLSEADAVRGVRIKEGTTTTTYRAKVVVDATGRARALARFLPQHRRPRRARYVAFKTHLENARGDHEACEIYFYRGGYGGLNNVEGGASNLCFIAAASAVRRAKSDVDQLLREVVCANRRAADALRGARPIAPWLSVALDHFGRGDLTPAHNMIAVGDAAAFIDPFTGSGMLMALESGQIAAEIVGEHLRGGATVDAASLGSSYARRYARHFDARLRFCSALRRLAFAPHLFAEIAAGALGASRLARRALSRATRGDFQSEQ